jgi:tetratricopeptide (TPR) repeat protein
MIHGLDTGFLVAAAVTEHGEHTGARDTLARLLSGGDLIAIAPQVLAEFPREALLMRLAHLLYNRGCSSVGEANFPVAYLGLLQKSAPYCDNNWAFLAEYAWAHHETGALDEAMRLAQRSLALNPSNAVAAHSVAHVYFERGDAGTGAEVLGDWLQGFDCPASS